MPAEPPGLCLQDPAVIQHRPSPQYATLDVYNPFEIPEVRFWRAQRARKGRGHQ